MKRIINEFSRKNDKVHVFTSDQQVVCPGSIVSKIDWFTVVFTDCTVFDALSALTFQQYEASDDFDAVYSNRFFQAQGYLPDIVFNFDGISVKVGYNDVLQMLYLEGEGDDLDKVDAYSFFDLTFRKVRCELSGSALDHLRAKGLDVDTLYFRPLPMANDRMTYHVTRCDVAFDLLDYMQSFLFDSLDFCHDFGNKQTMRVAVGRSGGGIKYSLRTGDQYTLYLGAASSDKLLRIYDKGFQFAHSDKIVPYVYDNGEIPSSWIRIELQCRREPQCHHILYDHNDFQDSVDCFLGVFRYIYDKFGFYRDGKTVDFWKQLFNWDQIPGILQKSYFVQLQLPAIERAEKYIRSTSFKNIAVFVAYYGWERFEQMINTMFYNLQISRLPQDKLRFTSLLCHILDGNESLPDYIYKLPNGKFTIGRS